MSLSSSDLTPLVGGGLTYAWKEYLKEHPSREGVRDPAIQRAFVLSAYPDIVKPVDVRKNPPGLPGDHLPEWLDKAQILDFLTRMRKATTVIEIRELLSQIPDRRTNGWLRLLHLEGDEDYLEKSLQNNQLEKVGQILDYYLQ